MINFDKELRFIMKEFFSKISVKTAIVSIVVILILAVVSLLVFKDLKLLSSNEDNTPAMPLPHAVACDESVVIREDIMYNKKRTQKDIKEYIDSIATGCIEKEMFWSIQGFLAEVYKKYPGKIDGWLRNKNINSIQLVQALIVPMDTPKNRGKYEKYIKKYVKNIDQYSRYMGYTPIKEDDFMVSLPGHIKFLWGRYFSYGDTKYLEKIARCVKYEYPEDCYMNVEVQDLAKATLKANSQKDEVVKQYLETNLPTYREGTQKILKWEILGIKGNDLDIENPEKTQKLPQDKIAGKKKKWFS
ncbi:MAG: hypothetical protein GX568_06670 [Candidatus Gastranaerophilales bacterium]|nr:hypothetical protein [Candidatus Gastranaerophilales bacterium]